MTANRVDSAHVTLVEEVATTVRSVPGVAFLKPGLGERLRSALSRPTAPGTGGTGSSAAAGVRLTRPDGDGPWRLDIHVVMLREARTADVARAVRAAVERRLHALVPVRPVPLVTVTVTGLV
ncbi:hypothetical protein OK074_0217 [Actinobacteria bacterium OK074]|nr:hypothetical protein OK074_0217 [Actinobacteria bacterium OK074]